MSRRTAARIAHHHPRACHERRHERGAQLVEAAFAIPIFLLFIFGFVDLGLGVFQTSEATSAAADGARVAIMRTSGADVSGSADRARIEAAIRARIPGQPVDAITVRCVQPDGEQVACADADPEQDKVQVDVSWAYAPISPLGHLVPAQTLHGSVTMAIIAQPSSSTPTSSTTTTTAPTSTTTSTSTTTTTTAPTTTTTAPLSVCSVQSAAVTPTPVGRRSNGRLQTGVAISITTNGSTMCTDVAVRFTPDEAATTLSTTKQSSTLYTATIDKNSYSWSTGAHTVTVLVAGVAKASTVLTVQ